MERSEDNSITFFRTAIRRFRSVYALAAIFNVYLVFVRARKATLIESADYIGVDVRFYHEFYTFLRLYSEKPQRAGSPSPPKRTLPSPTRRAKSPDLKYIKSRISLLHLESENPQLLVFNENEVPRAKAMELVQTTDGMGRLLGFHCAGDIGGSHLLSFNLLYGDNEPIPFYVELCSGPPSADFIRKTLARFKRAAIALGAALGERLDVNVHQKRSLSSEEWIALLRAIDGEDSEDALFIACENRSSLANIALNAQLNLTKAKIEAFRDDAAGRRAFVEFLTKYRQMLIFVLAFSTHDPIEAIIGTNLSPPVLQTLGEQMEAIERMFYDE